MCAPDSVFTQPQHLLYNARRPGRPPGCAFCLRRRLYLHTECIVQAPLCISAHV